MSGPANADDLSFLWDEQVSEGDFIEGIQRLINSGLAWKLEGTVGRQASAMIESGDCVLGEVGHTDYYGNYVPSRTEVEDGTLGSQSYADARRAERDGF